MSLKLTTGTSTKIYVANTYQYKEIQIAQDFNSTESATSNFVRAIGKKRPIYSYTEINDKPVSGNINIVKTDNYDFQEIAMGLKPADTYAGFTVSGTVPIYMLMQHNDENTGVGFASTWLPMVRIESDQEPVPLKGQITMQYGISASMIITLANPGIIEVLPASSGNATLSYTPVPFDGTEFLPAGVDSEGNYTYFVVDVDNGEIISSGDWSVSGTTLTVPSSVSNVMVAYQYAT